MRLLLAFGAMLLLLATPATAQDSGRGYLTSLARAMFLCASEGGFELGICPATARRLRFYAIERTDTHVDFEIQLAASGACLTSEGAPMPGARLTTGPCERQLWRYDFESSRLRYGGLCLLAAETGQGVTLGACEPAGAAAPRRQEWAIVTDH